MRGPPASPVRYRAIIADRPEYTRKSSEEGLEQEFNSLHAQREACEACVASQKQEGWIAVRDRYDDGGISGGTLERPGLRRPLADIEADRVDVVVVYKVDRLYLGEAVHKGKSHPGEHEAIVGRALWDRAHAVLAENGRARANTTRARTPAPLKGLLRCAACGSAMTPTHTRRRGRLYRYYVCLKSIRRGAEACPVRSIAAAGIEGLVLGQVRRLLRAPEVAARTVAACHELSDGNGDAAAREREVLEALGRLDAVWDELFPAEQTRVLRLLVDRAEVAPDGIDVRLRTAGVHSLVAEMMAEAGDEPAPDSEGSTEEAVA